MSQEKELQNRKRATQIASANRKDAVARATWRVVAKNGLEAATLRAIAREAGCTTGVLMHYFRDKEDLFLFALDQMFDEAETELREVLLEKNPVDGLKRFFFHYLVSTKESELQARGWLNFVGRALWNKRFLRKYRQRYARTRALIQKVLQAATQTGLLRRCPDMALEADALFALFDGATMHALLEPGRFPPERQKLLLDWHLVRLLKPSRRAGPAQFRRKRSAHFAEPESHAGNSLSWS
jgi:AcrR family transcriptional regulator